MKIFISIFITFAIFLSLSIQAIAGGGGKGGSSTDKGGGNGWTSSGGDDIYIGDGAAWFLGYSIDACIVRDPHYSKSEAELIEIINKSALIWKTYYETKVDPEKPKIMNIFSSRSSKPAFNFVFRKNCNDSQFYVKFIFGTKTAEVLEEMKKYHNPFGMAKLQSYDIGLMRGKGFLWFADPKVAYPGAHEASLNAMILHELGHVYGNPHVPGTIMDENIVKIILRSAEDASYLTDPKMTTVLTSIDTDRPLYFNFRSYWSYDGFVPETNSEKLQTLRTELLNTLLEHDPAGAVKAHLFNKDRGYDYRLSELDYRLELKDNQDSKTFMIKTNSESTHVEKAGLFKRLIDTPDLQRGYMMGIPNIGWELFGNLVDQQGVEYPVVVTLNLGDNNPVSVRVFYKGQMLKIFEVNPQYYYH